MTPVDLQNAREYDLHAESWQAAMPSNVVHQYLEKPAMVALLPRTLEGQHVLCIGVGSGEELNRLLQRTPAHITGIDISSGLLQLAAVSCPGVTLRKMAMSDLAFPDESFGLVYSSLALHYAPDWDPVLAGIYRVLRPGGTLLFSTHHPDYWALKSPTGQTFTNSRNITLTQHTALFPGDVTVIYYNHPSMNSLTEALAYAGFQDIQCVAPRLVEVELDSLTDQQRDDYLAIREKNAHSGDQSIDAAVKDEFYVNADLFPVVARKRDVLSGRGDDERDDLVSAHRGDDPVAMGGGEL